MPSDRSRQAGYQPGVDGCRYVAVVVSAVGQRQSKVVDKINTHELGVSISREPLEEEPEDVDPVEPVLGVVGVVAVTPAVGLVPVPAVVGAVADELVVGACALLSAVWRAKIKQMARTKRGEIRTSMLYVGCSYVLNPGYRQKDTVYETTSVNGREAKRRTGNETNRSP